MSIALEIQRVCRMRCASTARAGSIGRVSIGELAAVELLRFAWRRWSRRAHAGSSPGRGAREPARALRRVKDRATGSWLRICPDCGLPLEVTGGDELDVLDVTFTPDAEARTDDAAGASVHDAAGDR
jgi:hypothetical protein